MSHSKLIEKQVPGPTLGIGGIGVTRDSNPNQTSALQQQHLQHIIGSGRNSVTDHDNVGRNQFVGSNLQGPLAQKRQNTGQRIIEGTNKSIRASNKALPLSSHGGNTSSNNRNLQGHGDYSRGGGVHPGIPRPTVGSAAQRRPTNQRGSNANQYNSTSAAGYQNKANPSGLQNGGKNNLQNINMRPKKVSGKETSQQLKIAGASSLQREREVNSQSELGQIASGFTKPPSSNTNQNAGNFHRHQGGKMSVNQGGENVTIPSSRQLVSKPYQNSSSSASQNRLIRNFSRSQVDSGAGANRDSISIDRKPLMNKMITNSNSGAMPPQGSSAVTTIATQNSSTPVGSMPLAQAIYGSSHNRNYRGNKSKHATVEAGKNSLYSKRSLNHPGNNSVDSMRMQAFKSNMKEISQNVKKDQESYGIGQRDSRNLAGQKSPTVRSKNDGNNFDQGRQIASNTQALAGISSNQGISRTRVKGLQNSHSNKRLPTWKAAQGQTSLLTSEKGISSPVFERGGIADRSLDKVSVNSKVNLLSGGGAIMQLSRADLLKNEYKKVIENHPGTLAGRPGGNQYDDTDFLSRMFTNNGPKVGEPLGLNKKDSCEVLHKSQSMKMIGDTQANGIANSALSNVNSSSVAARMLARKSQIANVHTSTDAANDGSTETRKNGSKETRKLTNRGDTTGRNQQSQILNLSVDSTSHENKGAPVEFKPTSMFSLNGEKLMGQKMAEDEDVLNDDDIRKIDRLQLINASARFELLSANQQLIDFHLNRVMRSRFNKHEKRKLESPKNAKGQGLSAATKKLNNLYNIEKSVIDEVSEAEENNLTHQKIGNFSQKSSQFDIQKVGGGDPYSDNPGQKLDKERSNQTVFFSEKELAKDRNRDSMFGTMLLTNTMSKENEARMKEMQDPHNLMQLRLNDMHPMTFGDTVRLPVFREAQQQERK